ncbi:MAG: hypothetical protein HRT49_14760 [Cognatishimia sp.]|nr:hypothetical protein [Cognatishimia sp.]
MTEQMRAVASWADLTIKVEPVMDGQHVADSILHIANSPPSTKVHFMTVMARMMPLIGRG